MLGSSGSSNLIGMYRIVSFLLVLFSCLAVVGFAPDSFTVDELEALEAERKEAEAKLAALEQARDGTGIDLAKLDALLLSAAQERLRREEQAATAQNKLIDLRSRHAAAREALYRDEDALEDLLGALVSSSMSRPPALVTSPDQANTAVRSAVLMGDAAPILAERAKGLKAEIEALQKLDQDIQREQARLDTAQAVLALKRAEIEQLAVAKRAQFEDVVTDAAELRDHVAALGAQAETLRDLLTSLEEDAPPTPTLKPNVYASRTPSAPAPRTSGDLHPLGPQALGGFVRPVSGLVAEPYGKRRKTGETSKGITIVTQPEAQVLSPVDGIIVFADAFRSYGPSLILHTSDDYYVLLSGLGAIYGTVSQQVKAGEPVGYMSKDPSPPPELYFELIKNDQSVDPARWMKRGS